MPKYYKRKPKRYPKKKIAPTPDSRQAIRKGSGWKEWIKTAAGYAGPIASIVGNIATMVNAEQKNNDVHIDAQNITDSGTMNVLNGIAQGDGNSQRDGRSILLNNMSGKLTITKHASATYSTVRITILVDTECDGVMPTNAELLSAFDPNAPLNKDNGKRFVVLRTYIFTLSPQFPTKQIDLYRKLQFHARYKGTDATIDSVGTNGLFIQTMSNESTNYPVLDGYIRTNYYDN